MPNGEATQFHRRFYAQFLQNAQTMVSRRLRADMQGLGNLAGAPTFGQQAKDGKFTHRQLLQVVAGLWGLFQFDEFGKISPTGLNLAQGVQ